MFDLLFCFPYVSSPFKASHPVNFVRTLKVDVSKQYEGNFMQSAFKNKMKIL